MLTVLVTIPLAVFAWRQKAEAEHQTTVAQMERDEAMRQRAIAENNLADTNGALKTLQQALDALSGSTRSRRRSSRPNAASAREEARKNMAELTANIRGEQNDGSRRPDGPTARANARPEAFGHAGDSQDCRRRAERRSAQRLSPQDAEILRTLRLYENAYGARSIDALRRVQVLTPATAS